MGWRRASPADYAHPDDTETMPRIAVWQTAIIPRVLEPPDDPHRHRP
jgi:hypothetical protein